MTSILLLKMRKKRPLLLKSLALVFLPLVFLARPYWAGGDGLGLFMDNAGMVLIVLGVFGRIWAYMYVCGRKSIDLVVSGPYRLCRNPLYFSSLLLVTGIGLSLQNPWLLILLLAGYSAFHIPTILQEEKKLAGLFGAAYEEYRRSVPRLLPSLRYRRNQEIRHWPQTLVIDTGLLQKHLLEALLYLSALPLTASLQKLHMTGVLPAVW